MILSLLQPSLRQRDAEGEKGRTKNSTVATKILLSSAWQIVCVSKPSFKVILKECVVLFMHAYVLITSRQSIKSVLLGNRHQAS